MFFDCLNWKSLLEDNKVSDRGQWQVVGPKFDFQYTHKKNHAQIVKIKQF